MQSMSSEACPCYLMQQQHDRLTVLRADAHLLERRLLPASRVTLEELLNCSQ